MEDTLREMKKNKKVESVNVLILVLMEDTLRACSFWHNHQV